MSRGTPRWLAIGLLVFVGWAVGCAGGPARDVVGSVNRRTITLGSYNVLNFFDSFDDPYNDDEVMAPKGDRSLELLASVIDRADADLLAVTEMENEGALARFVERRLPDAGYEFIHVNHRIGLRGINNGFISRLRPGPVTVWRWSRLTLPDDERSWTFARDLTEVVFEPIEGRRLHVFIVHFKSKRTVDDDDPQSAAWRLAEARELRRLVDERLAADREALVAAVGDFNDTPDSPTLRALLEPRRGRASLVDISASMPAEKRITYLNPPYRSQIDYLLVSPALAGRLVEGSVKVVDAPGLDEASDHAPIIATFRIGAQ